MTNLVKQWLRPALFLLGGAAVGFLYYLFFGCKGQCAITSSPVISMLYMGVVGLLIGGITRKGD